MKIPRPRILATSVLHGAFMVFLTIWMLVKFPFLHWDENQVLWINSLIREGVGLTDKPAPDRFLFVNTTYSKQLVEVTDTDGFPLGNTDITDRVKLANLFKRLAVLNAHEYVVCDIRFTWPSANDSALQAACDTLQRLLLSRHVNEKEQLEPSIIKASYGLDNYTSYGLQDGFMRFRIALGDTQPTIPLRMLLDQNGNRFQQGWMFDRIGPNMVLDNFIVNLRLSQYDLSTGQYAFVNLDDLLAMPDEALMPFVQGRTIWIGNYLEDDLHSTLAGEMAGTLILCNTYLALEAGDNVVGWPFLLFLWGCFTLISLKIFVSGDFVENWLRKVSRNAELAGLLVEMVSIMFFLLTISVLSYFVFNIQLSVMLIGFYLLILEKRNKILDFLRLRKPAGSTVLEE